MRSPWLVRVCIALPSCRLVAGLVFAVHRKLEIIFSEPQVALPPASSSSMQNILRPREPPAAAIATEPILIVRDYGCGMSVSTLTHWYRCFALRRAYWFAQGDGDGNQR